MQKMISEEILKKIKEKVEKEDPIFKGVEPIISEEKVEVEEVEKINKKIRKIRGIGTSETNKNFPEKMTVMTFKKTAIAEDGAKIPIVRRITINEKGEIIKDTGN